VLVTNPELVSRTNLAIQGLDVGNVSIDACNNNTLLPDAEIQAAIGAPQSVCGSALFRAEANVRFASGLVKEWQQSGRDLAGLGSTTPEDVLTDAEETRSLLRSAVNECDRTAATAPACSAGQRALASYLVTAPLLSIFLADAVGGAPAEPGAVPAPDPEVVEEAPAEALAGPEEDSTKEAADRYLEIVCPVNRTIDAADAAARDQWAGGDATGSAMSADVERT
jgi:hypothetical protein